MTGRTNYTPITNSSAMLGPAQITAVYEHFDPLVGETVATASSLPTLGNWVGRSIFVADTKTDYKWDGAGWFVSGGVATFTDVVTFGTGWTALNTSNYKPRIRRQGNVCVLLGGVTAGTGATLGNILTIPDPLRPQDPSSRYVGAGITSNGQPSGYELVNGIMAIPTGYGGTGLTNSGVKHLLRLEWELDW